MLLAWSMAAFAVSFDALIADPVDVLLADEDTPAHFRIVALSHAAEACVGRHRDGNWTLERATDCVDRVTEAALDPRLSPYGAVISGIADLGEHGLFLSHLAIVLGARDALSAERCDSALHRRIAEHLAGRALAHPSGVGRSYPNTPARWPADQAATSYALWLYDRAHEGSLHEAPLARYLGALPQDRLPPSELTGTKPDASLPRGSALAFTVRYLAPVAPETARALWARARKEGFFEKVGPLVAMREWPVGVERPPDIDSGPIVNGMGASATAFGRAAARALRDETAPGFDRTATLGFQMAASLPGASSAARSALAAAISAQAGVKNPLGSAP